jgi:nucleotide-binding universal stress UspA family protein
MYDVILVPLDGSARAEKILPYVSGVINGRAAKVILLQVIEPVAPVVTPTEMVPYYDTDLIEAVKQEAVNYLAAKQSELQAQGIDAEALVMEGPIVRTILDVAEQKKVDLIALASHGRSGVARVFYGSVAAGILHSTDHPLLLIRAQDG